MLDFFSFRILVEMYLCKCLLEFGDDVCNSYTMVLHELCHVGWNESKSEVKEIRFYTSSSVLFTKKLAYFLLF